jgi:thiol:disulfide interchange protein DsbD
MAFPLYATVAYLLWVLAGQLSETALLNVLFALPLVGLAVWVYGRFSAPTRAALPRRLAMLCSSLLIAVAVAWGWPKPAPKGGVAWEPWSAQRVAELRAQGRPIYVDFTARWCATCQVNKRVVFASPALRKWFHDAGVVTLKADWTNADPAITAELARWGRSAVPFNLAYPAGGGPAPPKVLPEVLTPEIVLRALQAPTTP